jgi:anti-anti-sigma factor
MPQETRDVIDGLFSVNSEENEGGVPIVRLAGELDRARIETLVAAIDTAVAGGGRALVLDLRELEFLDLSGVALLRRLARGDGAVDYLRVIPGDAPGVSRVLSLSGVDALLTFVGTDPDPRMARAEDVALSPISSRS